MAASVDQARLVKNELVVRLAGDPGVVGIGLVRARSGWGVKVNVRRGMPQPAIPAALGGVPIRVETVGRIVAQ